MSRKKLSRRHFIAATALSSAALLSAPFVRTAHAAGKLSLVPALARAGVAIGADGLVVEVHPCPEKAVSDGAQSLTLENFRAMMKELAPYIQLWKESRAVPVGAR